MHYAHLNCPCGQIRGIGTDEYQLFKGIPYAKAQRWEAPLSVVAWEGELDATVQGKACPQRNAYTSIYTGSARFYRDENVEKQVLLYDEDCLNLNIWTPKNPEALPVLVYIHGGSYETGSGAMVAFDGKAYCRRGVILVTINYRLNAFASAVGDGHNGNYGLQDQICALRWIRDNIAAFGGDPGKVTIMGESAGAMSVQNLILSPMAKGLFRGGIMLSGGGILPKAFLIKHPKDMESLWAEVKAAFGAQTIDDLKKVPPRALYTTWKELSAANSKYAFPATPVIDGEFIPQDPCQVVTNGQHNIVPTILSVLSEDMWPHTLYEAITQWVKLTCHTDAPVYGAYFDRAIPGSDYGAYHGCDVRYAFGTLGISWRPFTDTDWRISNNMIDYFAAFAKTGVPQVEGLAKWLPLTADQPQFMHFGDDPCQMTNVPEERLQATQAKGKPFPGM